MRVCKRIERKMSMIAALLFACAAFSARSAHAAPYYVTVAGLGGEPDYEQRFTGLAKDLDKLFKSASRPTPIMS